jgi:hypothetical protein
MAALTYQSQLTATTAANSSQQMSQYIQTLANQQDLLHQNQHQMMEQMAALSFNQSDAGRRSASTASPLGADRDAAAGADAAGALLVATQEDVDHPSCHSRQDEVHQGTWDLRL